MTAVDSAAARAPALVTVRFDRTRLALAGIVIVQAVWLWVLIGRGWYLQADFSNLTEGVGRPLTWSYLREPLGGHFAPLLRALYWLFDRMGALDYTLTIAVRVALQAGSTVLLYRVISRLTGATRLNLIIVGLYAASPLLLPGIAWLTSGLGLVLGQVFALWAVDMHLRNEEAPQLLLALKTGVLLVLMVLAADEWVVIALLLPILSVACVYTGPIRDRLREFLVRWRSWLLTLVPLAGAAVAMLVLGDKAGAHSLGFGTAYRLIRDEWLRAVAPSLIGGHWRWFTPQTYLAFFAPNDATVLLGQLAFAVLLIIGFQRTGLRALVGWSIPAVVIVANMLLVGTGRYETYGRLLAITPRYSFVVAAPLAIGIAVSLAPATGTRGIHLPELHRRAVVVGLVVALTASSAYSSLRFSHYWAQNPSKRYVDSMLASARAAGARLNVYDTPLPPNIVSGVEPRHNVSDVLRLGGVKATYEDPRSEPLVVSADGHLTKSVFIPASVGLGNLKVSCGTYIHGPGVWTIPLSKAVAPASWYLRFELYQNAPSTITVDLVDAAGRVAYPVRGADVAIGSTLAALNLRLPVFAPVSVRVHSHSSATSLCLVRTVIGAPFPVGG
ncbi:MAG TPA: hypothetical protein VGL39_24720 [Jatrophihabitantaceae bacterium]